MSQGFGDGVRTAYSRAHLYGSKTSILGRAHVFKLKGDFFAAIFAVSGVQWQLMSRRQFSGARNRNRSLVGGVFSQHRALQLRQARNHVCYHVQATLYIRSMRSYFV